jgi:Protein of unknown function (DUF2808)
MLLKGFSTKRTAAALAIASCFVASFPLFSLAQSSPGLTIFSGVKAENQLNYHLDFGGKAGAWDRYRLRIPAKKMKVAVAQFVIDYPNYYKGTFNPKEIEVLANDKKVKLQEIKWDKDNYVLEIFPAEPIPVNTKVEIRLSDVKNPNNGGMFYFNCRVLSPGDVPLLRDIGTWIVGIE